MALLTMNGLYQPFADTDLNHLILVVNCGSSSIKATLFTSELHRLLDIHLDNMKSDSANIQIDSQQGQKSEEIDSIQNIREGLEQVLGWITKTHSIKPSQISVIGHRFVHGGPKFRSTTVLDSSVVEQLESLNELAPLHNAACLEGIRESMDLFGPNVKQVAVFDTAFYATMPSVAANYALPHELSEKYGIQRYGFHGIAHSFLWNCYQKHSQKAEAKIITLHLGNGCSITAIRDGKPIDTSMGFTPAEGLVMATRAGDVDAGVVEFLCRKEKKTAEEVVHLLNFRSGLLGISGKSSRMEKLLNEYEKNGHAKLAVDLFCYRALKYLGAYLTALKGADGIIFSGGIGENASEIRKQIIAGMEWYGLEIHPASNEKTKALAPGELSLISSEKSKVPIFVIGANENFAIAKSASTSQIS